MIRYVIISVIVGVLFGFLDGLINANPIGAQMQAYLKPIVRSTINIPAGITIDLIYGFVIAGIFLLLLPSLPGATPLMQGLSYGLIMWFFRTVMYSASQWMILQMSWAEAIYILLTGLIEMLILGAILGLYLKPTN